jgi:hypothetical protein
MEIRYGVVPSGAISDSVIVKNPMYGTPIGKWGSRPVKPPMNWYRKLEQENQFYTKLEASILEQGFRNPIFCNAIQEGTFSRYGTSRLWIAKKHNLDIPCVIADYTGEWEHLELLTTEDQIREKFKEQPEIFWEPEFRIDSCAHSHL